MKKILALVLVALLALSMISALADFTSDYTQNVTFSNGDEGNTVKMYKLLSASLNAATNELVYTKTGIAPAEYDTYEEIKAVVDAGTVGAMANAIGGIVGGTDATKTGTFGADGKATVNDVEPGWYYVIVSGTAVTGVVYQNMLVNTTPIAVEGSWHKAINNKDSSVTAEEIQIKKVPETITKVITGETDGTPKTTDGYTVGDDVPYTITTTIPNYPANSKVATFKITDTPDGLTLYPEDDSTHKYSITVEGDTTYQADTTDVLSIDVTSNKLTITFEKGYILAHAGKAVTVTYSSKLVGVPDKDGKTADNTATIIYNPNPHESGTVEPPDTTEVKTYGLVFEKVDEKSDPLVGATFALYDQTGTNPITDKDGNALTFTTSENNKVTISGKAHTYVWWDGLEAGTYTIKETNYPSGYVSIADFTMTVGATVSTSDNPATTDKVETNFTVKSDAVVNTKGVELPSTGGIGTTLFYVGGGLLALIAVVLLVTKRRMTGND